MKEFRWDLVVSSALLSTSIVAAATIMATKGDWAVAVSDKTVLRINCRTGVADDPLKLTPGQWVFPPPTEDGTFE